MNGRLPVPFHRHPPRSALLLGVELQSALVIPAAIEHPEDGHLVFIDALGDHRPALLVMCKPGRMSSRRTACPAWVPHHRPVLQRPSGKPFRLESRTYSRLLKAFQCHTIQRHRTTRVQGTSLTPGFEAQLHRSPPLSGAVFKRPIGRRPVLILGFMELPK